MILESKKIPYTAIDITDPGQEEAKDYMVTNATPKPNAKVPVTPQLFNEAEYCGVRPTWAWSLTLLKVLVGVFRV